MTALLEKVVSFADEKLLKPARQLSLAQALIAVVLGVMGGVFPIPMVTSIVTVALCKWARCSTPQLLLATTVNVLCSPLQLMMIPLFARCFAAIIGADGSVHTVSSLKASLEAGFVTFVLSSSTMLLYSAIMWLAVSTPIFLFCRSKQSKALRKLY